MTPLAGHRLDPDHMGELADLYFRELDVRPAWHRFAGIDWAAIQPERLPPVQVFAYTLVQEKATQLFYQQFARALAEPVLQGLMRVIARDEARHFAFFARVLTAYVERHGAPVLADVQEMLRRFKMPLAETLRGYWRWSLRIADAVGGYDHTAAYRELYRVVEAGAGARSWSQTRDLGAWIDAVQGPA